VDTGISSARKDKEEDQDTGPILKEWTGLLIKAGIWALLIYLFIFQVSVVSMVSMQPNFYEGDRLLIDKASYLFSPVKRFDVIVFETVDWDKVPREQNDYIKRVIGLPGETVLIRDGKVWIDGQKLDESRFRTENYNWLNNARELGSVGMKLVVPPGHYFVMGDNRGSSHDSRSEGLGFVPEGQIKGLVRLRYWPRGRWAWISRLN
jgi:signal peptidase I